ncbi:MAG: hypothetical protein KDK63_00250, partial [Chlamydiia bacterium]|nr:hypothetical protein [Chlamydiia bacterium]
MSVLALSNQKKIFHTFSLTPSKSPGKSEEILGKLLCIDTIAKYFCDGYIAHYKGGTNLSHATHLLSILLAHIQEKYGVPLDSFIENYCRLADFTWKISNAQTDKPTEETYQTIQSVGQKMGEAVLKAQKGEVVTLPTGYYNLKGGHAMLFDVVSNGDETFDVTVYNTGEGTEYHDTLESYDKKRILVPLKFKSVPKEILFFTGEGKSPSFLFFEYLVFFRVINHQDLKAADIYGTLFEQLYPYRDTQPPKKDDFQKPQEDGTCVWKCLFKHLSCQFSTEDYKKLRVAMDTEMLAIFTNAKKIENEVLANILRVATEKCHVKIKNAWEKKWLTEKETQCVQEKISAIQEALEESQAELSEKIDGSPPLSFEPLGEPPRISMYYIDLPFPKPLTTDSIYALQCSFNGNMALQFIVLLDVLQNDKIDRVTRVMITDHFLEKVDLTRTFWEKERTQNLLENVQEALTLYLDQTLFLHKYAGGKEVLSILTLYTIQDMLVRIEDKKNGNILLRHPSYNPIPELDKEPFFHLFHEKEIVRFNEIRAYYDALEKEKGEAFHHFSLEYRLDNSTIRDEPLSRICLSVIDQNPESQKDARDAFSFNVIKNLSDDVIAVAALHKSWSRFPSHMEGWIKALYQVQFLRNNGQQFGSWGISLEAKVIYHGGKDYFSVGPYTMVHKKHLPYHSKHPSSIQESAFIKPYNTKKGRFPWDGPREGTVLNEKKGSYLEKEVYWTASETDHHRFHLLAYYTGHLELFAEEHHQLFFHLQFFKGLISTQEETKTLVPFIKSPALLDLIIDFIEKGFDQFYKREPGKKPHLFPCLFFFRVLH